MDGISNSSENNPTKDLPLSANRNEFCVDHFILDVKCDLETQCFDGSITLFVQNAENSTEKISCPTPRLTNKRSNLVLDCYMLSVKECWLLRPSQKDLKLKELIPDSNGDIDEENDLKISNSKMISYRKLFSSLKDSEETTELEFKSKKHCLDIKLPCSASDYDHCDTMVIRIYFKTQPEGPSLMWTKDQDGIPCVFTIGDTFNNRSLFPAQDLPQAMSTWHCSVRLSEPDQLVLMTGETEPDIHTNENHERVFLYHSSYKMPAATFDLAVGSWSCSPLDQTQNVLGDAQLTDKIPRCRIVCPQAMKSVANNLLSQYLPRCFAAVGSLIEPYPFQRLDILIAPDCFDSLGLACPNLLILSQSLLSEDLSLLHRVAHELCHTWFGILLGQKNWTEEWLTEGMCCYLEDIVHARAMQWTDTETEERNTLKAYLKYKLLTSEIDYIPDSLQLLRPDGELKSGEEENKGFVTNGISCERSHVHYMKGFFLLKLLERTSGKEAFLSAVKSFVLQYKGKLFSSQELLQYFFSHCEKLKLTELTVSGLCHDWLDSPGLPEDLKSFPYNIEENRLYQKVLSQFDLLKSIVFPASPNKRKLDEGSNTICQQLMASHTSSGGVGDLEQLLPDQLVLLLTWTVESSWVRMPGAVIAGMRSHYALQMTNAEIQHAWCELVIQQRCKRWYKDVETFLYKHRAMGIYLYGELMISEQADLQRLAMKCYRHNCQSMPRACREELREILGVR